MWVGVSVRVGSWSFRDPARPSICWPQVSSLSETQMGAQPTGGALLDPTQMISSVLFLSLTDDGLSDMEGLIGFMVSWTHVLSDNEDFARLHGLKPVFSPTRRVWLVSCSWTHVLFDKEGLLGFVVLNQCSLQQGGSVWFHAISGGSLVLVLILSLKAPLVLNSIASLDIIGAWLTSLVGEYACRNVSLFPLLLHSPYGALSCL